MIIPGVTFVWVRMNVSSTFACTLSNHESWISSNLKTTQLQFVLPSVPVAAAPLVARPMTMAKEILIMLITTINLAGILERKAKANEYGPRPYLGDVLLSDSFKFIGLVAKMQYD